MELNPSKKAREIAEKALDRLRVEFETGRGEALQKYLGVMPL